LPMAPMAPMAMVADPPDELEILAPGISEDDVSWASHPHDDPPPTPIDLGSASPRLPIDGGDDGNLDELLARQEKEMLLAALARAAGVKKKAPTLLGINYRSFRPRLQKYGLDAHGDDSERVVLSRGPGH